MDIRTLTMPDVRCRPPLLHPRLGQAILGGVLLLGPGSAGRTQAPAPAPRGIHCEFIRRIDLDFANDPVSLPEAWRRNDGTVHHDRLGAFQVYALSPEDRYYENITAGRRSLNIRAHRLPGAPVPFSRVYYASTAGVPRFYYNPRPLAGRDQSVLLSFEHNCAHPRRTFRTYFLLDVLGTPAPLPGEEDATVDPHDRPFRLPDRNPACPNMLRLGVDFLADDHEGDAARDTRSGRLSGGRSATFTLHALGGDAEADRDITDDRERIQARVWTAPGSPSASGSFRFTRADAVRQLVFTLDRPSDRDRAAVLTFTYRCRTHRHRRDFLLEIPPGRSVKGESP